MIEKMKKFQDGLVVEANRVQKWVLSSIQDLSKVQFFHILRHINKEDDEMAN